MDTVEGVTNQPGPCFLYVFLSFFLFVFLIQLSVVLSYDYTGSSASQNVYSVCCIHTCDLCLLSAFHCPIKTKILKYEKSDSFPNTRGMRWHKASTAVWIRNNKADTSFFLLLLSAPSLTFSKDVHHCSAAELSDGLSCFITEVKRPDGEPYAPDSLFYLCLGIQQARWATLSTHFQFTICDFLLSHSKHLLLMDVTMLYYFVQHWLRSHTFCFFVWLLLFLCSTCWRTVTWRTYSVTPSSKSSQSGSTRSWKVSNPQP